MDAKNTRKSLEVLTRDGTSLQRLEQDVVPHTTRNAMQSFCEGLPATPETVTVLAAMLVGMLKEQLSEDAVWLSLNSAKGMCRNAGVSDAEFKRVYEIVMTKWIQMKKGHPMGNMF